jgi:hypothetical protein
MEKRHLQQTLSSSTRAGIVIDLPDGTLRTELHVLARRWLD